MRKTYIYTNQDDLDTIEQTDFENMVNENWPDKTFILCEDNTNILTNEQEDTLMVTEFVD